MVFCRRQGWITAASLTPPGLNCMLGSVMLTTHMYWSTLLHSWAALLGLHRKNCTKNLLVVCVCVCVQILPVYHLCLYLSFIIYPLSIYLRHLYFHFLIYVFYPISCSITDHLSSVNQSFVYLSSNHLLSLFIYHLLYLCLIHPPSPSVHLFIHLSINPSTHPFILSPNLSFCPLPIYMYVTSVHGKLPMSPHWWLQPWSTACWVSISSSCFHEEKPGSWPCTFH